MNCSLLWYVLLLFLPLLSSCYSFDYRTYSGVITQFVNDIQIVGAMTALQSVYPELVEVTSVQKEFNYSSKIKCGGSGVNQC